GTRPGPDRRSRCRWRYRPCSPETWGRGWRTGLRWSGTRPPRRSVPVDRLVWAGPERRRSRTRAYVSTVTSGITYLFPTEPAKERSSTRTREPAAGCEKGERHTER